MRKTHGLWELAIALALTLVRVEPLMGVRRYGRAEVLAIAVSTVATVSKEATVSIAATVNMAAHIVDEGGEGQGGKGAPANAQACFYPKWRRLARGTSHN